MARPDKNAAIAELEQSFRDAGAVVLTEYRGMSVAQLGELRRKLAGTARYVVAKNTLAAIAAERAGVELDREAFSGPTAITFVTGEPSEAAKALRDFGKENEQLVVKGGLLEGRVLTPEEITKLASLESRETLLGKAAGAFTAALFQAAYMFTAPATQAARTIDALREKQATAEA